MNSVTYASPWHALAAMSGAPTPSHEFPPPITGTRDSPKLGQPFERLNLGPAVPDSTNPFAFGDPSSSFSARRPPANSSPFFNSNSPSRQSSGTSIPSGAISGRGSRPESPMVRGLSSSSLAQRRSSMPMPSLNLGSCSGGAATSPASPLGTSSLSSRIQSLNPSELLALVGSESTLVLDLRPPSSFEACHCVGAHSVSVPSTLLRRPAFGLTKLIQMLSPKSKEAVSKWKDMSDIVLIDHDSSSVVEGSIICGVASKFDREGFSGKLWFLRGGHVIIDGDQRFQFQASSPGEEQTPGATESAAAPVGLGRLSRLAFQNGSTTAYHANHPTSMPQTAAAVVRPNPFMSLNMPQTARHPPRNYTSTEPTRARLQPANPFFDNIRQNIELSHGGITERIPLALSKDIVARADELPPFLRDLVKMPDEKSMEVLAQQFQRLERGEQERLQSVMDVLSNDHCSEHGGNVGTHIASSCDEVERLMMAAAASDANGPNGYYPFSITAGVERGTKNRYKNIWPYDFSRVRLGALADDDSDYINASFVQPRGTTRRYIATQGPLDATYRDFWTVVWEQNVHVIVMLTKQFEGGLLKCGQYWKEMQYGDLRLQFVSQTGGDDKALGASAGFDFGVAALAPQAESDQPQTNIKRTFKLWHKDSPANVRTVSQIQCVAWPDFDVPESPEILLRLMCDVDEAVEELCGGGVDRCNIPPVLVHCSAGIGRTGSYILADAVTDGLRRERRDAPLKRPPLVTAPESQASMPQVVSPTRVKTPEKMDIDLPVETEARAASAPVPKATRHKIKMPKAVTQSHHKHRQPTPISIMSDPIADILSAMRVQRMSLVQSLRQYLFVHRVVIAHYLRMIDREAKGASLETNRSADTHRTSSGDLERLSMGSGTSFLAPSTAPTSISGTDDEAHIKRKPSSTDLQPEQDIRLQLSSNKVDELRLNDEGSNLSKRLSFKKRRGETAPP